jgi:hypothetical protein
MTRTIVCLGLLVSLPSLACRTNTTGKPADAAIADEIGSGNGGTGMAGGGAGAGGGSDASGGATSHAGGGAGGGFEVGGGAGGSATGGAGFAYGGAGATGTVADADGEPEASREVEADIDGPADSGSGTQDSGVIDGSTSRDGNPLTAGEATALYRDYVNDPVSVYSLEELQVPGAWDAMGIQLFSAGYVDNAGYFLNLRSFVAFAGQLYPVSKYSPQLLSAVVVGDTLYFTMRAGSGINYSVLGKIWVSDAGLQILQSSDYMRPASSNLFLRESDGQIIAEMGSGSTFNSWTSSGVFGWIRDEGARVVIVDEAGTLIPIDGEGGW